MPPLAALAARVMPNLRPDLVIKGAERRKRRKEREKKKALGAKMTFHCVSKSSGQKHYFNRHGIQEQNFRGQVCPAVNCIFFGAPRQLSISFYALQQIFPTIIGHYCYYI